LPGKELYRTQAYPAPLQQRAEAALLKRHHIDKVPASDICNEYELQPSVFYTWQRQMFEHAAT
jgi:hypothetical protein